MGIFKKLFNNKCLVRECLLLEERNKYLLLFAKKILKFKWCIFSFFFFPRTHVNYSKQNHQLLTFIFPFLQNLSLNLSYMIMIIIVALCNWLSLLALIPWTWWALWVPTNTGHSMICEILTYVHIYYCWNSCGHACL